VIKMAKKSIAIVLLIVILGGLNIVQFLYFTIVLPQENNPLDVESVLNGNKEDYIGKIITLNGFYIEGGANISLLVTDPLVYENNSLTPSNYILIGGSVPSSLQGQQGAQVQITGKVSWADAEEGLLSIGYAKYEIIKEPVLGSMKNIMINPSLIKEGHDLVPLVQTKYAVLISGGINPEKAYARYWNDITTMYTILTWLYGYDPANIYIAYKDGVAENNYAPCHGPATHTFIESVFSELEGKMSRIDDLFIYTTNHGGSAGLSLWGPLDPYVLTPNELNTMLENIDYHQEIIVMEQCKSGVFIPTLSQAGRVILTACSPYQSSFGCDTEGPWDEFVYHFMCAVAKIKLNGDLGSVDADTSGDGRVSMYEAFMYASAHDSRLENPYYDDDGDGQGIMSYLLSLLDPADEGYFGSITFL
jgi:hypothetical protein